MDAAGSDTTAGAAARGASGKFYDAFLSYAHDADEVFAPVVQRGLQHLAKPWNRRRVMEVFRDETSLAASPGLWPSIRAALDASRWLVVLASPEAARSDWVGEEIMDPEVTGLTQRLSGRVRREGARPAAQPRAEVAGTVVRGVHVPPDLVAHRVPDAVRRGRPAPW